MMLADHAYAAMMRLTTELRERAEPRLPSERELAVRLGTSRTTVRKAMDLLEREGTIYRVKGRAGGAFVTGIDNIGSIDPGAPTVLTLRRLSRNLNTVKGVPQMLHEQGFQDGTQVLSAALEKPTPQVREILRIDPDQPVVALLRLRFADGESLSLERMYLRAPTEMLRTGLDSIYQTLRAEFGMAITTTEESIELASANDRIGKLLGRNVNAGLLRLERVGFDQENSPREYSVDLFRADRIRLRVRTTVAPSEYSSS